MLLVSCLDRPIREVEMEGNGAAPDAFGGRNATADGCVNARRVRRRIGAVREEIIILMVELWAADEEPHGQRAERCLIVANGPASARGTGHHRRLAREGQQQRQPATPG